MEPLSPLSNDKSRIMHGFELAAYGDVDLTRRHLLAYSVAGLGLATAGGAIKLTGEAIVADRLMADFLYKGVETGYPQLTTQVVNAARGVYPNHDRVVLHGGIGQIGQRCRQLAELLAAGIYHGRTIHYSNPAPEGIDLHQAAEAYSQLQEKSYFMHEISVSMGLLTRTGIHLAGADQYRQRHGKEMPAIMPAAGAVGSFTILNGPTMGLQTVYNGQMISELLRLWDDRDPHMSDKFAIKALDKLVNRHENDAGTALKGAARELFDRLPPRMWLSQIRQIRDINVLELAQQGRLAGFIGPWTRMLYVRSDDRVVKNAEACEAAEEVAALTGASFSVLTLENAGHANVARLAKDPKYRKWVGERTLPA
ncbi:MAG TPA: hypothetical protein VF733_02770 [Candidatus Saccharimonadales bacterium]